MEKLIALIEKGKPFFNAIARNKYLKAIRDGFISVMPIIIVSSIFLLVSAVPNVWGFYWPAEINDVLMKAYNYSMGIVGICAAATTAKHFCDAQNRDLPKNNQINFISVMIASLIGFLLLSSDAISFTDNGVSISGLANGYMGSKGLLTAFICVFATGIIYKFFIKRNITIKMPEQVPPNISQTFKDIIPFGVCLVFFWGFDFAFRNIFGFCFAQGVIQVFQPLFSAADGYLGLAIIYGAMSLFWFVGVHGPSIVEPAISAALISNLEFNMAMYQAGEHATAVLTKPLQDFVVAMGGTGATLVICFMFAFLAKSKEMRAVGRASAVPVCFGVNEPFLFGAPMVLNPIFFIPFIFAPIANIWITKFFIDVLGMNGFMFSLPWTTPAPVGIAMGLGLQPLAFLLIPALLIVDFLIYFPFFKVYDREKCAEEAAADQAEVAQRAAQKQAAMNAAFQGKADTASVATGAVAQAAASMAAEKMRAAG
jgi:PTS system lactose-specific IIC component